MGRTLNEHLRSADPNNKNVSIETDLTQTTLDPSTGVAREGYYVAECMSAASEPSSKGGWNVNTSWRITGPAGCSELGRRLFSSTPIPIGDVNDTDVQAKMRFYNLLVGSMVSHKTGKPREEVNAIRLTTNVEPVNMKGASAYVYVVEEMSPNNNPRNKVTFIMREDYEVAPGPSPERPNSTRQLGQGMTPNVPTTGTRQPEQPKEVHQDAAAFFAGNDQPQGQGQAQTAPGGGTSAQAAPQTAPGGGTEPQPGGGVNDFLASL